MRNQVIVIGLGRFGSSITSTLYNLGHDVLAVDLDVTRVQNIVGQSTHSISGDATNEQLLREIGIQEYTVAIVAIGANIVASIMTTVLLKTMGVPYIVARATNPLHANTLNRLGVDRVVQTESEMGSRIAHSLFSPDVQEYIELSSEFGISKILAPNQFQDRYLKDLGFSESKNGSGISVLSIRRGSKITLMPDIDTQLKEGDTLILAGKDEDINQLNLGNGDNETPPR
ncbi:MAG: TrkA family potassium uptake protein [SAR202 cluster bacterium]|nr:TrkA family potassium uptake protein [SAR202 cluster bacterium]|tara:strand:+ start:271 stop:957 length:687 start_codon:yes stop_codon:yes gene_type:complete